MLHYIMYAYNLHTCTCTLVYVKNSRFVYISLPYTLYICTICTCRCSHRLLYLDFYSGPQLQPSVFDRVWFPRHPTEFSVSSNRIQSTQLPSTHSIVSHCACANAEVDFRFRNSKLTRMKDVRTDATQGNPPLPSTVRTSFSDRIPLPLSPVVSPPIFLVVSPLFP